MRLNPKLKLHCCKNYYTYSTFSIISSSKRAGDSSQFMEALCHPPSPEGKTEVVEEECVEIKVHRSTAIPFFEHPKKDKILIKDGKVVNDDGVKPADVLIEDGIIVAVDEGLDPDSNTKVINASGKYVLPGGIDTSTFLYGRDDDVKQADDFDSGTKAALLGGTTTIIDNITVNVGKDESLIQVFNEWKESAEEKARCNIGFVIHLNHWNSSVEAELQELVKENNVNAVKIDMSGFDVKEALACMTSCKDLGVVVHVQGYNGSAVKLAEDRAIAHGTTGPEGHLISRPEELELDAMSRAQLLAKEINMPVVLNGLSSASTLDLVKDNTFGQIGIASLVVDGSHLFNSCWSHAAGFVSEPPLRDDPETPSKLLDSVLDKGSKFMICSHHKTFNFDQKADGKSDFTQIPKGVNGIQERLALVWHKVVSEDKGDPETVVALTSSNAAKTLNMFPKKGQIAEGSDADIVILDPEEVQSISCKDSNLDFNIYEGTKLQGTIKTVLLRGKVMAFDNEFNESSDEYQGDNILSLDTFPEYLYSGVTTTDNEEAPVERKLPLDLATDNQKPNNNTNIPAGFGKTTPRSGAGEQTPVLNKSLGVYQRPMSAHGIRNQQDSTFSLAGGYESPSRRNVKISSPPGGVSDSFW